MADHLSPSVERYGPSEFKNFDLNVDSYNNDDISQLDYTQRIALNMVKEGNNVFITGMSGTGKSFLIPYITHYFRQQKRRVVVMSGNQFGALEINGYYVFDIFRNLKILNMSGNGASKKARKNNVDNHFWEDVYAVILDNIHYMSTINIFNMISYMQNVKRGRRTQWIFLGDFSKTTINVCNSPVCVPSPSSPTTPEGKDEAKSSPPEHSAGENALPLVFETEEWNNDVLDLKPIVLNYPHRFKKDESWGVLIEKMWQGGNKEGIMLKLEALREEAKSTTNTDAEQKEGWPGLDAPSSPSSEEEQKEQDGLDASSSSSSEEEDSECDDEIPPFTTSDIDMKDPDDSNDMNHQFSDLHVSSPRSAPAPKPEIKSVLGDLSLDQLMENMPRTEFIYMETAARESNQKKMMELNTRILTFKSTQGTRVKNSLFPFYDKIDYKSLRKQEQMISRDNNLLFINEKLFNAFHLLKHHAPVENELHLAAGAFVVLTAPLCSYLPRGSQGIVVEISPRTNMYPLVHFRNGYTVCVRPYMFETPITKNSYAWYAQIPLKPCWYYLIQDITSNYAWEHVKVDMSLLRKPNLFYRICSQVQTCQGIQFSRINHIFFNMDPKCTAYNKSLTSGDHDDMEEPM